MVRWNYQYRLKKQLGRFNLHPDLLHVIYRESKKRCLDEDGNFAIMGFINRIPGMVAYMRPFSVPATAGTLASTYVRGGMVCL